MNVSNKRGSWCCSLEDQRTCLKHCICHSKDQSRDLRFAVHLKLTKHCQSTVHECSVTQLCLTFCDPMDCSQPDSTVYGIFQARILESVAISSSRGSSWPRDQASASCRIFYHWATGEAQALQQISKMSEIENVSGWSWSSWVHCTPRDKNEARIWNEIISVYHPETLVRPHTYI